MARFGHLALASTITIWLLVIVGGIVRVTSSGMGCGPDWPLCNGQLVPLFTLETFIEFFHRVASAAGSLLVVITAIVAWRSFRHEPWIVRPAVLAVGVLLVQILLGAVTVKLHLKFEVVTLHLGVAAVLLALLTLITSVAVAREQFPEVPLSNHRSARLTLVTVAATYLLLLIGSYMMGSGASLGCTGFPECSDGQWIPADRVAGQVHMLHRAVAVVVGILLAALFVRAWRSRGESPALLLTVSIAGLIYLAQFTAGVLNVLFYLPPVLRVVHLGLAFALWVGVVAVAAMAYAPVLVREPDRDARISPH